MELCTKRDMVDAARLISNFDIEPDLIHDLAQAIADGRRLSQDEAVIEAILGEDAALKDTKP